MSHSKQPCTERRYTVTERDLPLCCPLPSMRLWDGHPKVYLPIEETGHEQCYYCGAEFFLVTDDGSNEQP